MKYRLGIVPRTFRGPSCRARGKKQITARPSIFAAQGRDLEVTMLSAQITTT